MASQTDLRSTAYSPRLFPRPPQPSGVAITCRTVFNTLRVGLYVALVTYVINDAFLHWLHALLPDSSDALKFTLITVAMHESLYYGMNGFFMLCDRFHWLARYKIPRKAGQEPSTDLIRATLRESFVSHWIVQPTTTYLIYPFFAFFGTSFTDPLPSIATMTLQMIFIVTVNDTIFFWTHRLLHKPDWYRRFHKMHHEYVGPIGFAAERAHPFESFLSNQLPIVCGPLVLGVSPTLWTVLLFWRLWRTYEVHSGYDFSGSWLAQLGFLYSEGTKFHDFHHTKNKGNFGSGTMFWDHFCGTQDFYLASLARKTAQ